MDLDDEEELDEDELDALNERKGRRDRLVSVIWDAVFDYSGGHEGPGLTAEQERSLGVIERELSAALGLPYA